MTKKVLIFGGSGLAGSAIIEALSPHYEVYSPSRSECDIGEYDSTLRIIQKIQPDLVVNAAGKVGGILYNVEHQFDSLLENVNIGFNVARACYATDVDKYIYLGSNCIYPNNISEPISESRLLTSQLEKTNRSYALAKISSIQLLSAGNLRYGKKYFALMPPNLYGKNDIFNELQSHVLQALMLRMHQATAHPTPEVTVWGDGTPLREFLDTRDLARAILFLSDNSQRVDDLLTCASFPILNVGSGEEISIRGLAEKLKIVVGYKGSITFDSSKPNGTARKFLDSSLIYSLGWRPNIKLDDGIRELYNHFLTGNVRIG